MVVTTAPRRSIAADPPRAPAILLPDIGLERLPPAEGPKRGPELEVPPAPKPAPPGPGGGASSLKFTLREVLVEGATVFSDADLATSSQSLLGTAVSLADVQRVARTIESRYRARGFFLSRAIVPVQTITDGRVRIRVLEGGVDDIRIEGDVGPVEALIDDYLRPVAAEKPLRLATLERALLLCNDIPGLTVSGSLRPSAEQVGSADGGVAEKGLNDSDADTFRAQPSGECPAARMAGCPGDGCFRKRPAKE